MHFEFWSKSLFYNRKGQMVLQDLIDIKEGRLNLQNMEEERQNLLDLEEEKMSSSITIGCRLQWQESATKFDQKEKRNPPRRKKSSLTVKPPLTVIENTSVGSEKPSKTGEREKKRREKTLPWIERNNPLCLFYLTKIINELIVKILLSKNIFKFLC